MLRLLPLLPLLLVLPLLTSAGAAEPARLPDSEQLNALIRPYVEAELLKGVVVGIVTPEGTRVRGIGSTGNPAHRLPGADTLFEIGSITKTFTGGLLALMVKSGEVTLDQPVRTLLPETVKVPTFKGADDQVKEITLRHLATHTSGLPRLPDNFRPKDPENPYADYTPEQLYSFLGSARLTRAPGAEHEYSNLGTGLLGHALALKAGKPYETLVRERICIPLGMNQTRITLLPDQEARLARGHDGEGSPVKNWDIATLAGAGALRSTASDMLRYLQGHLGLPRPGQKPGEKSPVEEALPLILERRFTVGKSDSIGLNWYFLEDGLVWHNGGTGGYHSFAAFHPEKKFGVVVLSNSAVDRVDELGSNVARLMLGEKVTPSRIQKPVRLDPKLLDAYVGEYPLAPDFVVTIRRKGDGLEGQATGQPPFRLFPASETRFLLRVVDAEITFEKDKSGKVVALVLHQGGRDQRAPKRK